MKKKILSILLVIVFLLTAAFVLVGCFDNNDGDINNNGSSQNGDNKGGGDDDDDDKGGGDDDDDKGGGDDDDDDKGGGDDDDDDKGGGDDDDDGKLPDKIALLEKFEDAIGGDFIGYNVTGSGEFGAQMDHFTQRPGGGKGELNGRWGIRNEVNEANIKIVPGNSGIDLYEYIDMDVTDIYTSSTSKSHINGDIYVVDGVSYRYDDELKAYIGEYSIYTERASNIAYSLLTGNFTDFFEYILDVMYLGEIKEDIDGIDLKTSLSELIKITDALFDAVGFNYSLNKIIEENVTATKVGSGYELTVLSGDYTSAIEQLCDDAIGYFDMPFDDIIKDLFDMDVMSLIRGVKGVISAKLTMQDVKDILVNSFKSSHVSGEDVWDIFYAFIFNFVDIDDYLNMTVSEFIYEVTGGEYDYATGYDALEEFITEYLEMTPRKLFSEKMGGETVSDSCLSAVMGAYVNTAEIDLTAKFDKNMNLIKVEIEADIDVGSNYFINEDIYETNTSAKGTMSITGFGTTAVTAPVGALKRPRLRYDETELISSLEAGNDYLITLERGAGSDFTFEEADIYLYAYDIDGHSYINEATYYSEMNTSGLFTVFGNSVIVSAEKYTSIKNALLSGVTNYLILQIQINASFSAKIINNNHTMDINEYMYCSYMAVKDRPNFIYSAHELGEAFMNANDVEVNYRLNSAKELDISTRRQGCNIRYFDADGYLQEENLLFTNTQINNIITIDGNKIKLSGSAFKNIISEILLNEYGVEEYNISYFSMDLNFDVLYEIDGKLYILPYYQSIYVYYSISTASVYEGYGLSSKLVNGQEALITYSLNDASKIEFDSVCVDVAYIDTNYDYYEETICFTTEQSRAIVTLEDKGFNISGTAFRSILDGILSGWQIEYVTSLNITLNFIAEYSLNGQEFIHRLSVNSYCYNY